MKNVSNKAGNNNIKFNTNKHRPENKDDLDSRENEEQEIKGDDITHNQKINKRKRKTTKK